MSIRTQLECDFPECDTVKEDMVWWESTANQPLPWNKTYNGQHWCWLHTREEIAAHLPPKPILTPREEFEQTLNITLTEGQWQWIKEFYLRNPVTGGSDGP